MGVSFHFWVHCSIKHQAFLQVKSIFSPGCLGQVMTGQRSGAATQQAFCSNTKLMLHLKPLGLALHFSTMSLWSSLLVYDVKIPPTSYLWGNRTNYFFSAKVTEEEDDEALSETEQAMLHNICQFLTSSAESGGHPPHYQTPKRDQMRKWH